MQTKFSFFKGAGTVLALFLFLILTAQAQTVVKVFGYCERGGQRVMSGGSQSQTTVQKTYPGCTVRVLDTGTATLTAIYTNTGLTVKSNPFVADSTTGYWEFYVVKASRLDIQLSGGISPNNIASPFYWATDYSVVGESLPTLYNQNIIEQTYNAPSIALPQEPKLEVGAGLNVEDDPVTGSTLIKSTGSVTGKRNIITDYGGNGEPGTVTGTISAGSTSLTVSSLLAYRKGMYIAIPGLGISGATFYARITALNTATKVFTLDAAPAGNGTNVTVYPDNFTPIQNALTELSGSLYFPAGFYRVWNDGTRVLRLRSFGEGNPTILESDGQGAAWIRAMGNNDLFRATARAELSNLQIKNINFDTNSTVRSTTVGWAFNLGEASVVNFPQWENVQITGFRGAIFCNNCEGGGIEKSVFRFNKSGIKFITDQSTWLAGNENNVLTIKDNQIDFQADPNTDSDRALTGLSMIWEDDSAVTDASYIVSAATSQFTSDDVGRILEIPGEGTDGGNLVGMIMEYLSATQVKISTRGVRTSGTAFSGASGTIWRIPTSSMYFYRANWLTLQNNILQGNFGASTANVNSVVIRNSNSVKFINHYSEQGGGSGGAHVRLIDSFGVTFHGFKTNSQGACVATPPNQVSSHCWDIWATNTPGTRVYDAAGSLSILHNKLEGTSTIFNESLFGAPDLSNESGPQKQVYGDYHQNFQWGNVQIGTNTLYDGTYGDNHFTDGRLVDGISSWTTVVVGSVSYKTDGADRYKNYIRVDTTALPIASVTELITKRINIPDGLMTQNFVFAFDYRPVTYPSGSDNTYTVDFYVKPSTGGTGYNWPTAFRWQIPGTNAAGLTTGHWYRLQVNLVLPAGTGRYFDIAIRARRGALTPIVDFTNFMLMQGRHAAFSNDEVATARKGITFDAGAVVRLRDGAGSGIRTVCVDSTGTINSFGCAGILGDGGSVTSIGMTVPSWLSVSPSTITSSGTFAITSSTVCASCVVIGPTGVTGSLTARALIEGDVPNLSATKITSGVLSVARGGTGLTVAANNSVLIGDGTNWNSTTIPSCSNGTTDKLLYDSTLRSIICGVDQTGGGGTGITSLGVSGSPQTGATQTLAFTNGTNITGSWGSSSNIHTLTVGITGRIDAANLDTNVVYKHVTNVYTGGDQDLSGAVSFKVPIISSYAPASSGVFGYNSSANLFVGGHNGTSKNFVTTANSLGQVTNADVASAAAIALSKLATTTASRALVSDGSGVISASATTSTQIGYLSTATSNIQTQLDGKQATGNYITALTGDIAATGPGGGGSAAATITAGSITNTKLAVMAANTIKLNNTGSSAAPIDGTVSQARTLLGLSTTDQVVHGGLTVNPAYNTKGFTLNMSASGSASGDFLVGQEFNFTDTQTGNRLTAQPFRFNYNRNAGATGQPAAYDAMMVLVPTVNQNLTSPLYAIEIGGNFGSATISNYTRLKFTTNPGLITNDVAIGSDPAGGNFGFGTLSPTAKTHIVADSNSQTGLKLENTASSTVPAAQITSPTAIAAIRTPNQTSSNSSSSGHATTAVQIPIAVDSNGDYKPAQKLSMPGVTNSGTANGDIWFNGNVFGFREKGVSKSLPYVSRVSTNYSVTSSTTLADITGLTFDVEVGRIYSFYADIFTTSSASGGVKFSIGGTATASSVIASAFMYQGSSTSVGTQRVTAMNTVFGDQTSVSSADVTIRGTFHAATAGTVTLRFAQNASNGTPSVVLAGSTFGFIQVQ